MTDDIQNTLEWLTPQKETQEEINEKANAYENFYKSYFEMDLKRIMLEQILRKNQFEQSQEDMWFNKGILEGLRIVKQKFDEQTNLSLSRFEE
jgi:hypothetical protein